VLLRGPTLCSGYYKDPEKTASALRDGGLHTGDRGSLDTGGSLMFHGRLKDVLKVGRRECGRPRNRNGRSACTRQSRAARWWARRTGDWKKCRWYLSSCGTDREATEKEVVSFCTGKLASFKIPRRVYFVTEWPMSATKIDKPRSLGA